jgi:hypothetical protein
MIEILAGDFGRKTSARIQRTLDARPRCLVLPRDRAGTQRQEVAFERIAWIESVTAKNAQRIGGRMKWGFADGFLLVGLGGLARMVDTGVEEHVVFALILEDGRKLLGKAPAVEFTELKAATYRRRERWLQKLPDPARSGRRASGR